MWTEEKLKEVAEELMTDIHRREPLLGNLGKLEEVTKAAFVAGCKYIINNTQKENESVS